MEHDMNFDSLSSQAKSNWIVNIWLPFLSTYKWGFVFKKVHFSKHYQDNKN